MHEGSSPGPVLLLLCLPLLVFMALYCASQPAPLERGRYLDCLDRYVREAPKELQGTGIIWDAAHLVCEPYRKEDYDRGR